MNLRDVLIPIFESEKHPGNAESILNETEFIFQELVLQLIDMDKRNAEDEEFETIFKKLQTLLYIKDNYDEPSLRCIALFAGHRANFLNFLEIGTQLSGDHLLSDSQVSNFDSNTQS